MSFLDSLFNMADKKDLKQFSKIADQIDAAGEKYSAMTDEELQAMTPEFKERLKNGQTLDDILVDAFAVVREASTRILGMRHFKVQLIGGMVLHQGRIAEMKTGEGKTLVATCPVYLNALEGKGVHVVTVNDYLAKRDRDQMAKIYEFLGLSVGVIVHGQSPQVRKQQYDCDITYGTNNEYGFDYLKDNMVIHEEQMVQRGLHYAIVDEVDSILVDEARTPLIISGPGDKSTHLYSDANVFILTLNEDDYEKEEKDKAVSLTETGIKKAEVYFNVDNITTMEHTELYHHINQALKAHTIMKKDVDYVAKDDEIIIVDEFTGRLMFGRRYSDGLHQAIEAKEGLTIQRESKTLATITFQNYFRMYTKLSGMTGTAKTEEEEFKSIYKMDVFQVPTNKPLLRKDLADSVYANQLAKFRAVARDIKERHERNQPVLVGTVSIEKSELLSSILTEEGIAHEVLNAKFHELEAEIVSQAGQAGAVTIATNMAGRGTDIKLDDVARNAGGLMIIGTERHESRRIDNQLRGRSGRQGDPGSSRFYLSLEDGLMRIYLNEGKLNMMRKAFTQPGEAMESKLLAKVIASAQAKVEAFHFDGRKNLLEYDDVANDQRHAIYEQRNYLLDNDDISETIKAIRSDVFNDVIDQYIPPQSLEEQWDIKGLEERLAQEFGLELPIEHWLEENNNLHEENLRERIIQEAEDEYKAKEALAGEETMRHFEKGVMLQTLDELWKEHLAAMDYLRQGIHLRGYAQKDPKQEYKKESFRMFTEMLDSLKHHVITTLTRVKVRTQEEIEEAERARQEMAEREALTHQPVDENTEQAQSEDYSDRHIGRNEPCPCGSGKKYKHCHGSKARYA